MCVSNKVFHFKFFSTELFLEYFLYHPMVKVQTFVLFNFGTLPLAIFNVNFVRKKCSMNKEVVLKILNNHRIFCGIILKLYHIFFLNLWNLIAVLYIFFCVNLNYFLSTCWLHLWVHVLKKQKFFLTFILISICVLFQNYLDCIHKKCFFSKADL